MKFRNGFVSNSSSSSFIVIDAPSYLPFCSDEEHLVVDRGFGTYEFGWGPEDVMDMGARVIFSYIQATETEVTVDPLLEQALIATQRSNNLLLDMLEEVIKENSNVKSIEWNLGNDAYIDHQSHGSEGSNMEMFESKQSLKDFIFGSKSYIHLDNDNTGYYDDE